MNLHSLKPRPGSTHRTKRLGCGESSGHGKTSGKGHKGQKARQNKRPFHVVSLIYLHIAAVMLVTPRSMSPYTSRKTTDIKTRPGGK